MWSDLMNQASSGKLWFEHSVANESHKATVEWVNVLREMEKKAMQLRRPDGFPELTSAQQLADKFGEKATGPQGLQARLRQFIEVGEQISELFSYSIKKFEKEVAANANDLNSLGK